MTTTLTTETSEVTLPQIAGNGGLFVDGDWIESKDQDPNGDVRLIQMMDIGDGDYLNKSSRFLTSDKAKELRCTYLEAGDVLVSRMPDPLGRACIFPGDPKPCVTAVDVCIIRPDESRADRRWLKYMINSPRFRSQVERWSTGTTRARISRGNLGKIPFELPPLSEQKRIADILDKADAIRRKRQETLQFTEEFLQASFMDMFGDPITNPSGWPTHTIAELCTLVRGSSPRPKADPRYYGGPVPRLMVADITRDGWLVTPQIDSLTEEGAKKSRPVPSGTIVMAVSGNVGLMSELAIDACVHDGFVAFTELQTDVVAPKYLMLTLHFLKVTHEKRKAGAIFQNLTTHDIKALELPIPPLSRQQEFLRIFERAKQSEVKLGEIGAHTEDLFNSLVQRAFKGKL